MKLFFSQSRGIFIGLFIMCLGLSVTACTCQNPNPPNPNPPRTGPPVPPRTEPPKPSTCTPYVRGLVVPVQKGQIRVRSVAWSWKGDRFATVSVDGRVQVRDATYGIIKESFRYSVNTELWKVAFTPDDKGLLTVGADGSVRHWVNEKEVRSFPPPRAGMTSRSFDVRTIQEGGESLSLLAIGYSTAGGTGYLVWKTLESSTVGVAAKIATKQAVRSVALSKDGLLTAVGLENGTIELYQSKTGTLLSSFPQAHQKAVTSLSWNEKGTFLASGSMDKAVKIWHFASGKALQMVRTLRENRFPVTSVSFSPGDVFLSSTSMSLVDKEKGDLKVWGTKELAKAPMQIKEVPQPYFAMKQGSWGAAWHPSGKLAKLLLGMYTGNTYAIVVEGPSRWLWGKQFDAPVSHLLLSLTESGYVTSTSDGKIYRTPSKTPGQKYDVTQFTAPINTIQWERDKQDLFVGLANGEVHRVDLSNSKILSSYTGSQHSVSEIAVRRDGKGLAAGFANGHIALFSSKDLTKPLAVWKNAHKDAVTSVVWSHDGKLLATASKDGTSKLWRYDAKQRTIQLVRAFPTPSGAIPTRVRLSVADTKLAIGYTNGHLGIYHLSTKHWKVFHTSYGTSVIAWHHGDVELLLTAAGPSDPLSKKDLNIHLWNTTDLQQTEHVTTINAGAKHHKKPITDIYLSWNDQNVLTSGQDGQLIAWILRRAYAVMGATYNSNPVSLASRGDGGQVIAGTTSSLVHMYNVAGSSNPSARMMSGHKQSVGQLTLSKKGDRLYSAGSDGKLMQWDMTKFSPSLIHSFPSKTSTFKPAPHIRGMALNPAQTTAVVAAVGVAKYKGKIEGLLLGGEIAIWDLQNPSSPAQIIHEIPQMYSIAWHPTRDLFVVGEEKGSVVVWTKKNGRWSIERRFDAIHSKGVYHIVFDPSNGDIVASAGLYGDIRVWNLSTGKQLHRFDSGGPAPRHISFHPAGHSVAVALSNGQVKIWDLKKGELSRVLEDPALKKKGIFKKAHEGSATLTWSADGRTIFTAGGDQTIKQWHCAAK